MKEILLQLIEEEKVRVVMRSRRRASASASGTVRYGGRDRSLLETALLVKISKMAAPSPSGLRRQRHDSNAPPMKRNYEYVAEPPDKYTCPVCFELLFDPRLLDCCGHHICEPCLKKMQLSNMAGPVRCPLCQATGFSTMLNKGVAREVRGIQVYCPNASVEAISEGCDWVGEIGMVEEHLSPGISDNFDSRLCKFEKVPCPNKGCEEEIFRRDIISHRVGECPFRMLECEFCKNYKGTYTDLTNSHYVTCPSYPVNCPNECGAYIARFLIPDHLEKCPNQLIDCDFKPFGCEFRRKRDAINGHLEVYTNYHLRLLCKAVSANAAKLETVDELEKQVATLQEENKKAREENSDLVNEINQLKSDVANMQKQKESLDQQLQTMKNQEDELEKKMNEQTIAMDDVKKERAKLEEELMQIKEAVNQGAELKEVKEVVESQRATVVTLQGDVAQCKETIDSHSTEVKSLRQSMAEEVDKQAAVMIEIKDASAKLEQRTKEAKDELTAAVQADAEAQKGQIADIDKNLKYVEGWLTPRPPFAFTVSRFQERKSHKEAFVSPPLYHNLRGYKMCVRVDVYGMNNHVAVFCCIMRGEHDALLDWPFLGAIKIRLQNHLGDHDHFEKDIVFDRKTDEKKSGRVKTGDKNYLHGHPQFIAHNKLAFDAEKNCQYLKGDALDFEVIGVELFPRNE